MNRVRIFRRRNNRRATAQDTERQIRSRAGNQTGSLFTEGSRSLTAFKQSLADTLKTHSALTITVAAILVGLLLATLLKNRLEPGDL